MDSLTNHLNVTNLAQVVPPYDPETMPASVAQETSSGFPLSAVLGLVIAIIVVVALVILVIRRRRSIG